MSAFQAVRLNAVTYPVEPGEREEHADRDHRAGHRVAHGREADRADDQGRRVETQRIAEEDGQRRDEERGHTGQLQAAAHDLVARALGQVHPGVALAGAA